MTLREAFDLASGIATMRRVARQIQRNKEAAEFLEMHGDDKPLEELANRVDELRADVDELKDKQKNLDSRLTTISEMIEEQDQH